MPPRCASGSRREARARAARWPTGMNFRFLLRRGAGAVVDRLQRRARPPRRLALRPARLGGAPGEPGRDRQGRRAAGALVSARRARAPAPRGDARCLSWSGSMFEYLMPLLVTRSACEARCSMRPTSRPSPPARLRPRARRALGISESAYNVMDLEMTYQYRAFGVPGLGLKAGPRRRPGGRALRDRAGRLVRPRSGARRTCARWRARALEGPYGYYEAIDYTPARVPPGRTRRGRQGVHGAPPGHDAGRARQRAPRRADAAALSRRSARQGDASCCSRSACRCGAGARDRAPRSADAAARRAPSCRRVEHVGARRHGALRAHLLGHGELSTLVAAPAPASPPGRASTSTASARTRCSTPAASSCTCAT